MNPISRFFLAAAVAAMLPVHLSRGGEPAGQPPEVVEPEISIELLPGRSKLLRSKLPVVRFSVTKPEVVGFTLLTPTQFELIPQVPGQTTVTVWFKPSEGNPIPLRYLVTVKEPLPP